MLGKIIEHRLKISGDWTIRAKLLLFDEDIPAGAEGGSGVPEAIICGGFQGSFALAPTPSEMLQGYCFPEQWGGSLWQRVKAPLCPVRGEAGTLVRRS